MDTINRSTSISSAARDHVLCRRVLNGEHELFLLLVQYHHNKMQRALQLVFSGDEDIASALCSIYAKAFRNLYRFYGETPFFTWLLGGGIAEAKLMTGSMEKSVDDLDRKLALLMKHRFTLPVRDISIALNLEVEDVRALLSQANKDLVSEILNVAIPENNPADARILKSIQDVIFQRKSGSATVEQQSEYTNVQQHHVNNMENIRQEHRDNLDVCRNIRYGFMKGVEMHRIKEYADWYWRNHLMMHFVSEETVIFPMLGKQNPLVKKALAEHRRLRRLFESKDDINKMLNRIEEELESHVLFEEKVLFREIEKSGDSMQLELVDKLHNQTEGAKHTWTDEFWK